MRHFTAKMPLDNDYISSLSPDDDVLRTQITCLLPDFLEINAASICWSQQKCIALYLELYSLFNKENIDPRVQNKVFYSTYCSEKGWSPFNS